MHETKQLCCLNILDNPPRQLNQLDVIAEGIETREQLEFLVAQDCDLVQGYYYYRPLPAEVIEIMLAENRAEKSIVN